MQTTQSPSVPAIPEAALNVSSTKSSIAAKHRRSRVESTGSDKSRTASGRRKSLAAALLNVEECMAVPLGRKAYAQFAKNSEGEFPLLDRQIGFLSALIEARTKAVHAEEVRRLHQEFFSGDGTLGVSEFNITMMANTVNSFAVLSIFDGAETVGCIVSDLDCILGPIQIQFSRGYVISQAFAY